MMHWMGASVMVRGVLEVAAVVILGLVLLGAGWTAAALLAGHVDRREGLWVTVLLP